MSVTDSIAGVSRKLARSKYRKVSVALFRYFPAKRGLARIDDFDGDLSMILDRGSYISSAIYWGGVHSAEIAQYVREFLRPEMVFADIGANVGELTLIAAKRVPRGRVLSFEPSPFLFEQLSKNVMLNGFQQASLYNVGLFDRPGTASLFLRDDHPYGTTNYGMSSLFAAGSAGQGATVPLRRFDDVVAESGIQRLDLMKVDVEGAELMVLRGAEKSLRRFRPVIIAEIIEQNFRSAGYGTQDLFAFLRSLEYEVPCAQSDLAAMPFKCDAVCFPREFGRPLEMLAAG